jgi:hypothetical protein
LLKKFVEHYMAERFHQGIGGQFIRNAGPTNDNGTDGKVACRSGLAGSSTSITGRSLETRRWLSGQQGETVNYFAAPSVIISRTESLAGTLVA